MEKKNTHYISFDKNGEAQIRQRDPMRGPRARGKAILAAKSAAKPKN